MMLCENDSLKVSHTVKELPTDRIADALSWQLSDVVDMLALIYRKHNDVDATNLIEVVTYVFGSFKP